MKVAIVSLGYVGLPLAMQFERPNITVVDPDRPDLAPLNAVYVPLSFRKTCARIALAAQLRRQ